MSVVLLVLATQAQAVETVPRDRIVPQEHLYVGCTSRHWLSFTTQLSSDALELEGQFERGLVLLGSFVVGVAETGLDQAHVDASTLGFFDGYAHERQLGTTTLRAQAPALPLCARVIATLGLEH